ncbi:MAG: DUF72 domain-containing protein [Limisphaerales bacterium]
MGTKILIGTASWQEPDFIEYWYPRGLPKTKLLPYYAEHFNYVEVNGSFYGIPQAKTTAQWCKQTPEGFTFDVKLHRLLSRHSTEAKFLPPDLRSHADIARGRVVLNAKIEKLVAEKFIAGIEPLIEAKKLGALLLQLSPSFSVKTNELSELDHVLELFEAFPIAVELRNRYWLTDEQVADTVVFFAKRKVTLVSVDAPPSSEHFTVMPCVDFVTNPKLAYFRLHGRNEEAYVKGRTVQERFDYDYSEEELVDFAKRVSGMEKPVEAVHVVFNNNRHQYAPKAAEKFMEVAARENKKFDVSRPRKKQPELILG